MSTSTANSVADKDASLSGIWTVHSESGGKPGLRGFAKTRREAETMMARYKADDQDAGADYWLVELSTTALEDFRDAGMVPDGF